jgi:hypothetical protein
MKIKNSLNRLVSTVKFNFRNFKYHLNNFIFPKHVQWRKTLPRHKYADITYLLTESNFNLILDFYHENEDFGWIDWNATEENIKFFSELQKNVEWLKSERKILDEKISSEIYKLCRSDDSSSEKLQSLEQEKIQKETEILVWAVTNRSFFWM